MKKILIAVDGSDDSTKALEQGGELAKNAGAEVVLVAVQRCLTDIESLLPGVSYLLKKTEHSGEKDIFKEVDDKLSSIGQGFLEECKKTLEEKGVNVKTVLGCEKPADEILKVADEEGIDMIVVGCKGKHLSKRFLGSVSNEVSERSKVSVLIAR